MLSAKMGETMMSGLGLLLSCAFCGRCISRTSSRFSRTSSRCISRTSSNYFCGLDGSSCGGSLYLLSSSSKLLFISTSLCSSSISSIAGIFGLGSRRSCGRRFFLPRTSSSWLLITSGSWLLIASSS
jgi:hypothetical protein